MIDNFECVRCGEVFETATGRTMHVIRARCPEIDSDGDVESADTAHALDEVFRTLGAEGGSDDA